MGFLLECPNCGKRDVYEFRFGGEAHRRPRVNSSSEEWMKYVYMRENVAGVQQEWWFHRLGCHKWFLAIRDTRDNSVMRTFWMGEELV
ncbi:MAG: sarcosine oxidase subunit delta [Thaumarchaeota archaeon]|nr:MAG: sarcosine oxidase subunit delta [Nitrososphaerota archaeon]TLY00394.1 MAG: sarcosine oxidase subunit delta [Nitrososphaerota archaeon]